jgi:broad specificity phosphatase PhoE
MLIRHAEKPVVGGPTHGVTVEGEIDAESLTPRGWQRAGALVGLFVPDPSADRGTKLPTPTHLVASQVGPQSSSARPIETLLPLSERLGLAVDSRFAKEELGQMVQAIEAIDGIVLVAWEHHLIPAIATMLAGNASGVPQVWPDDRYDVVWVLEALGHKQADRSLRQVPQMLLSGDQQTVIASTPTSARSPDR